jgi:hypothetical protein
VRRLPHKPTTEAKRPWRWNGLLPHRLERNPPLKGSRWEQPVSEVEYVQALQDRMNEVSPNGLPIQPDLAKVTLGEFRQCARSEHIDVVLLVLVARERLEELVDEPVRGAQKKYSTRTEDAGDPGEKGVVILDMFDHLETRHNVEAAEIIRDAHGVFDIEKKVPPSVSRSGMPHRFGRIIYSDYLSRVLGKKRRSVSLARAEIENALLLHEWNSELVSSEVPGKGPGVPPRHCPFLFDIRESSGWLRSHGAQTGVAWEIAFTSDPMRASAPTR